MHNATDRDTYGYRGFYMDAVRAFDLLLSLPEVDPERVAVRGSSQGGALTLLVAALRAGKVAAAAAGAPYLCSMMDAASLTRSYPYEEINDYVRTYPERRQTMTDVLNYYDIHNFVDRIRCPIIVNIGLRTTCALRRPATRSTAPSAATTNVSTRTRTVPTTRAAAPDTAPS